MSVSIWGSQGLHLFPIAAKSFTTREELFLYLVISLAADSAALVREEDKVQKPMYYANRALCDAKERYPLMEKLAFTLVTIAPKLKPYF